MFKKTNARGVYITEITEYRHWCTVCVLYLNKRVYVHHRHQRHTHLGTDNLDRYIRKHHRHSNLGTIGCSDFHFFSYFWGCLTFPLFLGTQEFRKCKKKLIYLQPFCPNFFGLFRKSIFFFRNFQN